jgi:hypothetical protein
MGGSHRSAAGEQKSENWNAKGCREEWLAFHGIILADRNNL